MGRTYRSRKRRNLSSLDIPPHVRDHVLEKLCVWMTQNGWKPVTQLRPFVFNDTGRGLQCLSSLPVGHVIVSIPENIVITCKKVLGSSFSKIFEDNTNPSYPTAQQILATFLILERRLSTESEWSFYISSIPPKFSTPLFQPERQKFPMYLQEKIKKEADRLEASLLWVNSQLLINRIEQITWQEYLWAWYAVNSRAVFVEPSAERICKDKDNMALAPFLDLLNHSPNIRPNQVWHLKSTTITRVSKFHVPVRRLDGATVSTKSRRPRASAGTAKCSSAMAPTIT
jgi:SET domain